MVFLYHILGLITLVGLLLGILQIFNLYENFKEKSRKREEEKWASHIPQKEWERLQLIKNREDKINKLLR